MRIFTVRGITKTGKTTTIEAVIGELHRRGYRVGSVKEVHFEQFRIDTAGTNTDRHRKAGSGLVTARGFHETDVLFQEKLSIQKIISFYEGQYDYLVMEGVSDAAVPCIVTAGTAEDADQKWNDWVFCLSGRMSAEVTDYRGVPAINALTDLGRLADLIEEKTYDRLPDFPPNCCTACGYTCRTLGIEIMNGRKCRGDCILADAKTHVRVGGREISMVPFVQQIVKNTVLSVIGELEGYSKEKSVEVKIDGETF